MLLGTLEKYDNHFLLVTTVFSMSYEFIIQSIQRLDESLI